ncbi:MAG: zinc-dependent alcohol dehydrogenase family protein [Acidobacteriota bacterium]
MRAALLRRQAPIEEAPLQLEDRPVPAPGAGEVLIRVYACGVCHTDLHLVEGDLPLIKEPVVPGHQIVGRIEAAGEGVDAGRVGARVGVPWLSSSCGNCDLCHDGRENLCQQARFTGYHVDGGYAEYAVAPATAAHPLPEGFSDLEAAPLLCAGIIGYRSLRLAEVRPGSRLGLYGFGASAHLAIQVARHWGCEVYVFTRGRRHRQLAHRLGAAWVGDARDEPPARLDAAISFAPAGWIIPEALRALAPAGTLAVNAVHLDAVPSLDYRRHLYGERTLRSVTNLTHADAEEFLRLAGEIPVRTQVESLPLEAANEALLKLKASRIEAAAVLEMSSEG